MVRAEVTRSPAATRLRDLVLEAGGAARLRLPTGGSTTFQGGSIDGCSFSIRGTHGTSVPDGLCGGLETGQSLTIVQHKPEGFATWTDYVPVFRLGVGDKMKIKFLITREMDDEITVGPDGFVGVRVAGRVRAEGQTITDLQDAIIAGSRKTCCGRRASSCRWRTRRPGGSMSAVRCARRASIAWATTAGHAAGDHPGGRLRHGGAHAGGGPDPAQRQQPADAAHRQRARSHPDRRARERRPLAPGDIIYTSWRSHIAEVNLWVEQFINRVVPFQRTFNYTIGRQSP
ncbi:MAG: polysaccharide biosynthesis/export family protein [bacterium]|nr:polysaccharide biosynthesis/export family protein [bacterium]